MPVKTKPDEEMERTRRSTIDHELVLKKKKPQYYMLRDCVLPSIKPPDGTKKFPETGIGHTKYLQRAYQRQYWRMITADPENRLKHTYGMNCPPAGFLVSPVTRSCKNPRICPWCFVRLRLLPIFNALQEPPLQFRNLQRVVCWRRTLLRPLDKLPFFRCDRGPHGWCNASVTAQTIIPFFNTDLRKIVFHHVGVQLVPKDADLQRALKRDSIRPPLQIHAYEDATSEVIGQAMELVLSFDWLNLYRREHLQQFIALSNIMEKNQKLLRINRFKSEENSDETQLPAVPQDPTSPA